MSFNRLYSYWVKQLHCDRQKDAICKIGKPDNCTEQLKYAAIVVAW